MGEGRGTFEYLSQGLIFDPANGEFRRSWKHFCSGLAGAQFRFAGAQNRSNVSIIHKSGKFAGPRLETAEFSPEPISVSPEVFPQN